MIHATPAAAQAAPDPTRAVAEIAAGDRVHPIREEGPREIRVLAHSVNTLSAQLREMEETRKKLLANLVHELGRPLGAMSAAVQAEGMSIRSGRFTRRPGAALPRRGRA